MSNISIGLIGIVVLVLLLFSRMPIGATMAFVGSVGFGSIVGMESMLGMLQTVPFSTFASQAMSVIPLFVLMGSLCFACGMSEDLYYAVNAWLGRFRGGLAMATIGACALFAAISGSSLATVATLGKVAWPEMVRYKYHPRLSTGAIAAGGCLGILIPPSTVLIIYGVITEQSIGALFMAGFAPGIMEALFYIIVIIYLTWRNPELGPKGPSSTWGQKGKSLAKCWDVIIIFLVVIGGIYTGKFTPTEAAGIGAFFALIFVGVRRKLTPKLYIGAVEDTIKTTGMLFIIVFGAMVFGYFLTVTRLPYELSEFVFSLNVSRYVALSAVLIVILLLGCIMDSLAIVLLAVPVLYPMIMKLGFDPIWFGIMTVRVTEMGLITPPVGLNVYIIQGLTGVPMSTCFRGIVPFLISDFVHIVVLILFPGIATFLPEILGMHTPIK